MPRLLSSFMERFFGMHLAGSCTRTFDASSALVEAFLRGEGHADEVTPPDARVSVVTANDPFRENAAPTLGRLGVGWKLPHRSHGSGHFAYPIAPPRTTKERS